MFFDKKLPIISLFISYQSLFGVNSQYWDIQKRIFLVPTRNLSAYVCSSRDLPQTPRKTICIVSSLLRQCVWSPASPLYHSCIFTLLGQNFFSKVCSMLAFLLLSGQVFEKTTYMFYLKLCVQYAWNFPGSFPTIKQPSIYFPWGRSNVFGAQKWIWPKWTKINFPQKLCSKIRPMFAWSFPIMLKTLLQRC